MGCLHKGQLFAIEKISETFLDIFLSMIWGDLFLYKVLLFL